ncbi:hypothetical protein ACF3MZ_29280 [Paenibacillaceae bacterium WGS1546]|uniref:hypothetical protein n=1 Tax=Cohnella sp. WGS1546 TaxID=3366810 RepID=UPI00372D23A0
MDSEMMRECVVLNGQVINIGPWDYQIQSLEVSPEERDEEGNIIKEAVYEDRPSNPLPDGAEIIEMEIVEGPDGGLYPAEQLPGPSEVERLRGENLELKLALTELAKAQEEDKTEIQLALAELAELYTGGE